MGQVLCCGLVPQMATRLLLFFSCKGIHLEALWGIHKNQNGRGFWSASIFQGKGKIWFWPLDCFLDLRQILKDFLYPDQSEDSSQEDTDIIKLS